MYEDLSAFKSRIRIVRQVMVTEGTMNIVMSVPNFESNSFRGRSFEIVFEKRGDSGSIEVGAMIKCAG